MSKALKLAIRLGPDMVFPSTQGDLLAHQLYTLPLKHPTRASLNAVANAVQVKIDSYKNSETDFVGDIEENDDVAAALQIEEAKLEIVKIVIKDVKKEQAAEEKAQEDAANDRVLDQLIAKKELEALDANDIESLKAMKSTNKKKKK